MHDLDNYSDLSFTPEQAKKIHNHISKLQTGASAMVPLICGGSQCQPEGTFVKTVSHGDVKIEDLNPDIHKLQVYDLNNYAIRKGRKNKLYGFKVCNRDYNSELIKILTNLESHQCTKNHISIVKWNKKALNAFVVYLMEKDGFFRIGKTRLMIQGDGSRSRFSPGYRLGAEKAHRLWILGVYETNTEALLQEERYSLMYQIPKALFLATNKKETKWNGLYKWVTQEQLNEHHLSLKKPIEHYEKMLNDFGLDIRYPLCFSNETHCLCFKFSGRVKNFNQFGFNSTLLIRACNIIPEYMNIPVFSDSRECRNYKLKSGEISQKNAKIIPEWKQVVNIERSFFKGKVYSLEVDKYETYISNNIITHNCPFKERCPLYLMGKAPVLKMCLLETQVLKHYIYQYMYEYNVDPENFTEVGYCNELAEIEVYLWRLNMNLAKPENAELVLDQNIGIGKNGEAITQKQLSPFMDLKDKLYNRRSKIIKLMVGDRQERYKKEAALKQKEDKDPSSKQAEMRRKIEALQRGLDKIENVNSDVSNFVIDDVLTPESLINSEDE